MVYKEQVLKCLSLPQHKTCVRPCTGSNETLVHILHMACIPHMALHRSCLGMQNLVLKKAWVKKSK